MRVDYRVGWQEYKSEWVCFEHTGFARQKAVAWWKRRSPDPVPTTTEQAVELANSGALATTQAITVRTESGKQYDRIVNHELGPLPESLPDAAAVGASYENDDIPF
jgi:DNA repair protein RadD